MYHVAFTKNAVRNLKKMDRATASLIIGWIRKNLEGSDNPSIHGKELSADKAGQWRYRVGDYRILAEIRDKEILVLVVSIGHRREVYK